MRKKVDLKMLKPAGNVRKEEGEDVELTTVVQGMYVIETLKIDD